jgi:hypothetical protein
MEFDELKQVWDSQNNELLWAVNEKALHNRILSKKKQAYHITNTSELLLIIVNMAAGYFIFQMNLSGHNGNIFMYVLAAWMLGVSWYLLFSRIRRLKKDKQFDRSMRGDLNYAISVATYQVRLSLLGRWSILPIGLLTLLGLWQSGKPVWIIAIILIFFALTTYASKWEHKIYKTKKSELEILKNKLENNV